MIQKALNESRIKVVTVKDKRLVSKLEEDFGLGKGEAESIALALAKRARIVGIDDKNGINACKLVGIAFTTAIGVLIRMRERKLLSVNESLTKLALLAKHGRYKQSILEDAKRKLEATA